MEFLSFITHRNRGEKHSSNGHSLRTPYNSREKESNWIAENAALLKKQYLGQWIVVEGEKLVAAAEKLSDAIKKAKAAGIVIPYVFHVQEEHAYITR